MVRNQGNVDGQREPFPGKQEQQVEQQMKHIFRQNERIQRVALINRVLVVRFQLIEGNHMEYREKDQKCVDDQGHNVAECREVESHRSQKKPSFASRENTV